jgi:predicted alpha/beta-hydrolase family hydrolase
VLEAAFQDTWREVTATVAAAAFFAGGKSMGGRIASQAAAAGGLAPAPSGLVCFGYPLHPPGKPAERRDRHLSHIAVPALFVHGTRDPFGTPEEMRAAVPLVARGTLHLVAGGDHSLQVGAREDRTPRAFDAMLDASAAWMRDRIVPV